MLCVSWSVAISSQCLVAAVGGRYKNYWPNSCCLEPTVLWFAFSEWNNGMFINLTIHDWQIVFILLEATQAWSVRYTSPRPHCDKESEWLHWCAGCRETNCPISSNRQVVMLLDSNTHHPLLLGIGILTLGEPQILLYSLFLSNRDGETRWTSVPISLR